MLNIIVIEDHDSLRTVTVNTLNKHDYHAVGLSCAEDLDDVAASEPVDIFIIDLNLPDEDGISLTKRIRKTNSKVGIIIMSARIGLEDKLLGYESGADIYLPKPVDSEELLAAIAALARRLKPVQTDTPDVVLDYAQLVLHANGKQISVNQAEAILLQALSRAKNQQLEHWQLIEAIDKSDSFTKAHLEVKIHRLRHKLAELGFDKNSIKNVRQQGYQLCLTLFVR